MRDVPGRDVETRVRQLSANGCSKFGIAPNPGLRTPEQSRGNPGGPFGLSSQSKRQIDG